MLVLLVKRKKSYVKYAERKELISNNPAFSKEKKKERKRR